jgi:hypothetical protein
MLQKDELHVANLIIGLVHLIVVGLASFMKGFIYLDLPHKSIDVRECEENYSLYPVK